MTLEYDAQNNELLAESFPAPGPLVVSKANPRYFTVAGNGPSAGRAVFLTGSHIWNNLQDGMGPGPKCASVPEPFDFEAYLRFLKKRGHNFIRLWRWEQFKSQAAGGSYHLCMAPQPWVRTGVGSATDGKPKFDLNGFDEGYFARLRDRVAAAGREGIYVGIMLFEGRALHLSPSPDNVEGHPFFGQNNVNGIHITSIRDYQVRPLDALVKSFQETYIRKVVDAVHDMPNVLWEVANESSGGGTVDKAFAGSLGLKTPPDWGDSTEWQYWVIKVVKDHERQQGYAVRPIGMTMQFPVANQTRVNDPLYASGAEWISPGYDDEVFKDGGHPKAPGSPPSRWFNDPPAGDGRKVVISDTDHFAPGKGDALWAWKSFVRGHHTILMDFGLTGGFQAEAESFKSFEATRYAMGDTRRYADRMNLIGMAPCGDLTSTGFALANPGKEYLVLQPLADSPSFDVQLQRGTYSVEWHSVATRETTDAPDLTVEKDGQVAFSSPFATGPAVLYLKAE
jgi:hypothetical protein